jgi:hypothetical protein
MAFLARDITFEMVPDGLWSFDGTSVFGLPSKYNRSGRRHAASSTVASPTEAQKGQGATHVAMHIANERCILQRILNNTKSRNNYLKIKPLRI